MNRVANVGVVGTYPNGGFPAQAFYGIQGFQLQQQPAPTGAATDGNLNLFDQTTVVTTVATIVILLVGGYALWHFA